MSKKKFSEAPKPKQPTDDQIRTYEASGIGHGQSTAAPAEAQVIRKEPTKRLSIDLPASTHTHFKTACSATGRKMADELQAYIKKRTLELEEQAGISHK